MRTIALSIRGTLRRRYNETWSRDWPEDDKYLSELWLEAQGSYPTPQRGRNVGKVYDDTLDLMRESHQFG